VDSLVAQSGSKKLSKLLLLLFIAIFFIPAYFFLFESFLSEEARSFPLWQSQLLRPIFRVLQSTFIQALLSSLGSGVLGLGFGFFLAFFDFSHKHQWVKFFRLLGNYCYTLPGVSVAMFVLLAARAFPAIPSQGLWAIVWAHIFMNFLYVSIQVFYLLTAWLSKTGKQDLENAWMLGMSPLRSIVTLMPRILAPQFFSIIVPVFLYSCVAFSTVLILGADPQIATPEVLLFYFASSDPNPERLRFVFLWVFVFYSILFLLFRKYLKPKEHFNFGQWNLGSDFALFKNAPVWSLVLLPLFSLPALSFLFLPLWRMFEEMLLKQKSVDILWFQATLRSFGIALFAGMLAVLVYRGLLRSRSSYNQVMMHWIVFSPMQLVLFWLASPIAAFDIDSALLQFLLLSVLLVALQWPLIAFWIEERKVQLPRELIESSLVLGLSPKQIPSKIFTPLFRDLEYRIFYTVALLSFGEIILFDLFAPRWEVLATLSRQTASRYDFFGVSWSLLMTFVFGILLSILGRYFSRVGNKLK